MSYEVVQIISCNDNGKLSFNESGFKSVLDQIPNLPIVIFSIAGKYRIGKSFLMSSLIPVLEEYEKYKTIRWFRKEDFDFHAHGFQFKSGSTSTTKGINLLNRPFIIPNPNNSYENLAVLLMDTQGLDALDVKGGVDQVLFTLTNFLSSHIIYNVCGNIEPNKLLSLIQLASHSKDHRKDTFSSLDVLIRDYKFTKGDLQEMKRESKNYVNEICSTAGSIVGNNLRELKDYFRCVNCCPLPNPGRKVETSKFNGDTKDINNKFVELLYDYIFVLFDSNHVVSKFENGDDLLRLFKALCDRTLNQARINADDFYRLMTENKDNKIIQKFKSNHLTPLKSSYDDCKNMLQLQVRINTVRNEYRKVENSVYDKKKLREINFEYEVSIIENKFRQELERKKIIEETRRESQRQQELLEQQRRILAEQQAQKEAEDREKRKQYEELIYKINHPPPPVYVYHHDDSGGCKIM